MTQTLSGLPKSFTICDLMYTTAVQQQNTPTIFHETNMQPPVP